MTVSKEPDCSEFSSDPHSSPSKPSCSDSRRFFTRILGDYQRIPALDTARGLAIFGMFTAHMLPLNPVFPDFLIGVSHGRSAALFAFLAGMSLGIITGKHDIPSGVQLLQARMRVAVRALILLCLVAVLSFINTGIILILGYYACWFLVSLPFLNWDQRRLWWLAGGLILVGLPLTALIRCLSETFSFGSFFADSAAYLYIISGTYGGAGFLSYIFAGLALVRAGVLQPNRRGSDLVKKMLVSGLAALIVGAGGATLAGSVHSGRPSQIIFGTENCFTSTCSTEFSSLKPEGLILGVGQPAGHEISQEHSCPFTSFNTETKSAGSFKTAGGGEPYLSSLFDENFIYSAFLDGNPHSNSVLETTGNLGFSLLVVSLMLLGGRKLAKTLFPLAVMGSMSLTLYCVHVFWYALSAALGFNQVESYFVMLVCFVVFSCLWRYFCGRGPLEYLLHWVSGRVSQV